MKKTIFLTLISCMLTSCYTTVDKREIKKELTELHKIIMDLRLAVASEKLEQSKILGDVENQFYEAVGISQPESIYNKFYITIDKLDKLGAEHEEKFNAIGKKIIAIDELLQ